MIRVEERRTERVVRDTETHRGLGTQNDRETKIGDETRIIDGSIDQNRGLVRLDANDIATSPIGMFTIGEGQGKENPDPNVTNVAPLHTTTVLIPIL